MPVLCLQGQLRPHLRASDVGQHGSILAGPQGASDEDVPFNEDRPLVTVEEGEWPGSGEPGKQQSSLRSCHKEYMSRTREVKGLHTPITPSAHSPVMLGRGWLRDPRILWGGRFRLGAGAPRGRAHKAAHPGQP